MDIIEALFIIETAIIGIIDHGGEFSIELDTIDGFSTLTLTDTGNGSITYQIDNGHLHTAPHDKAERQIENFVRGL